MAAFLAACTIRAMLHKSYALPLGPPFGFPAVLYTDNPITSFLKS